MRRSGILAAALFCCACGRPPKQVAPAPGDIERGKAVIAYYGCGSCHTIAGIDEARGMVGPPLTGVALRTYVAGMLRNSPREMARWIRNPKAVNPQTAMPYLGVTEKDADDIVAYLYTVK